MVAYSIKTITASAPINHTSDVNPNIPHKMLSNKYFCPFYWKIRHIIYMDTLTAIFEVNTYANTTTVKR